MNTEIVRQDIRVRVEARLGERIDERIWAHLVESGVLAQVERGEKDLEWLADQVRRLFGLTGKLRPMDEPPRMVGAADARRVDARQRAVSVLLAREAAQVPAVQGFRGTVLKGKLFNSVEGAEAWAYKQWKSDGPPTVWLTGIPVPRGVRLVREEGSGRIGTVSALRLDGDRGAEGFVIREIPIALTGDEPFTAATNKEGVLEELRRVAEGLREEFPWTLTQAVLFVLTGMSPTVEPIRARREVSKRIPACVRLVLEIDPTVTPRELAKYYRHSRRELWGKRLRNLTEKHACLAEFGVQRAQSGEGRWKQHLATWNRRYPKWRYKSVANFQRDSVQAEKRLLGHHRGAAVGDLTPWADLGHSSGDVTTPGWPLTTRRQRRLSGGSADS